MPRSAYDFDSILRRMTIEELRREVVKCAGKERERGMPAKARRSWKEAKERADAELVRRSQSGG
jgi:hypothetical protein